MASKTDFQKAIDYINSPEYKFSFTQFYQFIESPRHLTRYLAGDRDVTEAMTFSRYLHVYILEGKDVFYSRYVVVDEDVKIGSTQERGFVEDCIDCYYETGGVTDNVLSETFKANYSIKGKSEDKVLAEAKDKYSKFKRWIHLSGQALREQKEVILKKVIDEIELMVEVFYDDLDMVRIFDCATFLEKKYTGEIFVDPVEGDKRGPFGLNVTGKIDLHGFEHGKPFAGDLKVLASAATRKAIRRISDDYLYVQAALYRELLRLHGVNIEKYYLLVLDRKLNSNILEVSSAYMDEGLVKFKEALVWFRYCKNVDGWKRSYNFYSDQGDGVFTINPPWWMVQSENS